MRGKHLLEEKLAGEPKAARDLPPCRVDPRPEFVFAGAKAAVIFGLQAFSAEAKIVLHHLETFRQRAGKRYFLNIWDQKENRAIDMNLWRACRRNWDASGWPLPHELLARFVNRECWVGVDLSMTTDLSAVAAVFPRERTGIRRTTVLLDARGPPEKIGPGRNAL